MIITQAKKAEYKALLDYASNTELSDESARQIVDAWPDLTDEQAKRIIEAFTDSLGLKESPYILIQHSEAKEGSDSLDD